jgi:hypothetical protein
MKTIIIALVFLMSVYQTKAEKIAVDSEGNVYVLGQIQLSITFSDSTTIVANMDPFELPKTYLVKLDSGGSVLWYKLFDQSEKWFDIQVDNDDNLIMASQLMGRIALDSANIFEGTFQFLIAKFNQDGDLLWYNLSSEYSNGSYISIAIDAQNNMYTTSKFTGNFHFHGPDTISGDYPSYRPYIAKFNSSGQNIWLQKLDSRSCFIADIDVDDLGNVVVAGNFKQSIIHQGDTLNAGEDYLGFWMKFDPGGNLLKAKQIYSPGGTSISNLGAGKNGHFSYVGFFHGDTLFIEDVAPIINASTQGGNFVAHVDHTETESWFLNFNGEFFSSRLGIEMDISNNTYLYSLEEYYFYSNALNAFVGADISLSNFLIKIDSLGNYLCFLKLTGGRITDATILENGPIYIIGRFEDELTLNGFTYTQQGNNIFIASFDLNCNTTWTSLISDHVTAIHEVSTTEQGISIYPNPAHYTTTISLSDYPVRSGKIILYTAEGKAVMEQDFKNKEKIELNIERLAPGTYIIQVITQDFKQMNYRIVKI